MHIYINLFLDLKTHITIISYANYYSQVSPGTYNENLSIIKDLFFDFLKVFEIEEICNLDLENLMVFLNFYIEKFNNTRKIKFYIFRRRNN